MIKKAHSGFTLIEILIAVLVFAVLMVTSFQMFNSVIDLNDRSETQFRQQNQLNIAWAVIFQDLLQLRPRMHRDIQGDIVSAYSTNQDYLALFTRAGLPPINGVTPGGMQLVAYQLDEEKLQLKRLSWQVLDLANDSEPVEQVLISGVKDAKLEHLTRENEWSEVWPPVNFNDAPGAINATNQLPSMIRVSLVLDDERELVRLMPGLAQ